MVGLCTHVSLLFVLLLSLLSLSTQFAWADLPCATVHQLRSGDQTGASLAVRTEAKVSKEREKERQEAEALRIEREIEAETLRLMSEKPHLTAKQARALVVSKNYFNFFATAGKILFERDFYLQAVMRNLIAKGHILILGPPGNAKTLSIKTVFENIIERKTGEPSLFRAQLTPETTLSDTHGGLNYKVLTRTGRQRRLYDEGALGALFAYFNEKFDARPNALRNQLELMAEGTHSQGNQTEKGRTWIVVGDSNRYLPEVYEKFNGGDEPRAVLDRYSEILFFPAELENVSSNRQLIQGVQQDIKMPKLHFEDIRDIHALVPDVKIPNHVADLMALMQYNLKPALEMREQAAVKEYQEKLLAGEKPVQPYRSTKYMSDRTKGKAAVLLKAIVVLDYLAKGGERDLVATTEDLQQLQHFYTLGGPRPEFVAKQKARAAKEMEREQLKTIETEREIYKETLDLLLQDFVAEIATVDAQRIESQVRRYKRLSDLEKRDLLEELKNLYHEATLADQTQHVDQLDAKIVARAALKDAVDHWVRTIEPDKADRLLHVFGKGRFLITPREKQSERESEAEGSPVRDSEVTVTSANQTTGPRETGARLESVSISKRPAHEVGGGTWRGVLPVTLEITTGQVQELLLHYGSNNRLIDPVTREELHFYSDVTGDVIYARALPDGNYLVQHQDGSTILGRNGLVSQLKSSAQSSDVPMGGNAAEVFSDGSLFLANGSGVNAVIVPRTTSGAYQTESPISVKLPEIGEHNHASASPRGSHVWVVGGDGLAKVDRNGNAAEYFDSSGARLQEFRSVYELSDGSLILAGASGLFRASAGANPAENRLQVVRINGDRFLFARPIDDRFVVALNETQSHLQVSDLKHHKIVSESDRVELGVSNFRVPLEFSADKSKVYFGAGPSENRAYEFDLNLVYETPASVKKRDETGKERAETGARAKERTGAESSATRSKVTGAQLVETSDVQHQIHAVVELQNGTRLIGTEETVVNKNRNGVALSVADKPAIHFLPIGNDIVVESGGYLSRTVRILYSSSRNPIRTIEVDRPKESLLLDKDTLAVLTFNDGLIIFDIKSGARLAQHAIHKSGSQYPGSLLLYSDGRVLLTDGNSIVAINSPRLNAGDPSYPTPTSIFKGTADILTLAPVTGGILAVFRNGEVVRITGASAGRGAAKLVYDGKEAIVSAAKIDEHNFALVSDTGTLRIIDETGSVHFETRLFADKRSGGEILAVSPDGKRLYVKDPEKSHAYQIFELTYDRR